MTIRKIRYGIGKTWCLWWLFGAIDPMLLWGWKVVEARAERTRLFGHLFVWWPFWKCSFKLYKEEVQMKQFAVAIAALFCLAAAVQACPPPVAIVQQQAVVYQQPIALLQTYFVPTITTYALPQVQIQAQANVYSSAAMVNVQANVVAARACAKGCGARRGILRGRSVARSRSVVRMR